MASSFFGGTSGGSGGFLLEFSKRFVKDSTTEVFNQFEVSSDRTLEINQVGIQNDNQSAPTGLDIEIYNLTDSQLVLSKNEKSVTGLSDSVSGAKDVEIRVSNTTGQDQNASIKVKGKLS